MGSGSSTNLCTTFMSSHPSPSYRPCYSILVLVSPSVYLKWTPTTFEMQPLQGYIILDSLWAIDLLMFNIFQPLYRLSDQLCDVVIWGSVLVFKITFKQPNKSHLITDEVKWGKDKAFLPNPFVKVYNHGLATMVLQMFRLTPKLNILIKAMWSTH